MSFLESMEQRYTTKKYSAGKIIPADQIEAIKKILQLSPSSIDSQPWQFTIIANQPLKEQLAPVSYHNNHKLENCSHVVVFNVIDNIALFEKEIQEYLPEGSVAYYNRMVKPRGEAYIKAWFGRQVYIALGVLLGACATMDIDATPMEGIETDRYTEILGLKDYKTIVAVAMGYRDPEDSNQPSITPKKRLPIEKVLQSID